MYYACFNVHGPYQGKDSLIQYYEKKLKTMPSDNKQTNPVMAAMLHGMDQELETILNKLDELNLSPLRQKRPFHLVIFTSDNGGVHWEMGKKKGHAYNMPVTSNLPLRGGKSSWFEGGVRVPMIMRWPGHITSEKENRGYACFNVHLNRPLSYHLIRHSNRTSTQSGFRWCRIEPNL